MTTELYDKYNRLKIKQEAIVLIDELFAEATYVSSESPRHPHDWLDDNGKNDWDFWKVFIQEKNKTVWEATLNIANSSNGEKILYDINPIKMVEQAGESATSTTNNIISQNLSKVNSKILKQDRDSPSVYDTMGETERLRKENEKLRTDIERLREMNTLEKRVTNGAIFNTNQIGVAAGHIRNISKSNIDKVELMKSLKGFYSCIAESPELAWEDVYGRAYRIAEDVLAESKPEVMIMLF